MRRPASYCRGVLAAGAVAAGLDAADEAAAGAWTLPEGEGLVIVGAEAKLADERYGGDGAPRPTPRFTKFELATYFEYGLVDRLTLFAAPRLERVDIAPPRTATRTGFAHTEIGARWNALRFDPPTAGLWQGSVISLQGSVRIPGSVDTSDPLAGSVASPEYDGRLLAGTAFAVGDWTGYLDVAGGYRLRDGPPPDEVRLDVTLGLRPRPDLTLMGQAFLVETVEPGTRSSPAGGYLRLQLSTLYDFGPRWAVQAGGSSVVTGRNALVESGVFVALWHRF